MPRIHDPVYGYIPVEEYETKLVDCLLMQRLRGIHQQGTAYLTYPSSTHDRFTHSLGVMKLADDALEILHRKYPRAYDETTFKCLKPLIRIVALWHDVGCGPFSHVSDRIIFQNMSSSERDELESYSVVEDRLAPHEYLSLKCLKECLPEYLNGIKPSIMEYLKSQEISLELLKLLLSFLTENANLVLNKKMPLSYFLSAPGMPRGPLLYDLPVKQLISSDFDVDKLDYIQRDAYVTGVKFGHLDVDGLLENLRLFNPSIGLVFDTPALSSIETLVLERYKLYRWLNFHHTVCFTDEIAARIIELAIACGIFQKDDFGYIHLEALSKGDIEFMQTGKPYYPCEIVDDHTVLEKVRRSTIDDEKGRLARRFLGLIERRDFYTSLWKVRDPLSEEEQLTLLGISRGIKKDLDNGRGVYDGTVTKLEQKISADLKIAQEDVIIAYKPFKPISTRLDIHILVGNDKAVKITELSSLIELLYDRTVQPCWELRKELLDAIVTLLKSNKIKKIKQEDLSEILRKIIVDIPQLYAPLYIYVKGLKEEEIPEVRSKVFKQLAS